MTNFCVNKLTIKYRDKKLFENLSFEVGFPAFVAVVGSNGSGKTSFFKAITRQIPFEGQLLLDGSPVLMDQIALLPQHSHVHFDFKVKEVVVMGLFRLKKTLENYSSQDFVKVSEVLEELGIGDLANKNFQKLSGGEKQLVWLAQLILQDKPIWLLDEPLQQLDVKNKVKLTRIMQEYAYKKHKLIFCITHDLHFLSEDLKGWILNISSPKEGLQPISPSNVEKAFSLLAL